VGVFTLFLLICCVKCPDLKVQTDRLDHGLNHAANPSTEYMDGWMWLVEENQMYGTRNQSVENYLISFFYISFPRFF
jgi:hypothetical protein